MAFDSFLVMLVIAVVVAAVMHYGLKLYIRNDLQSFIAKIAVAFLGARVGELIFGDWFARATYSDVALIPAALGAAAVLFVAVDIIKTLQAARSSS
ncbi:MAG: hypothetical protein SFV21_11025 [Rhodospirillaceae bacterium]|nr:hypothetical protein [Rhodospirillaceae bacterium]